MAGVDVIPSGYWGDKTVLVTGATGMVGSWLVKSLVDANSSVVAFVLDDDPRSELYRSGYALRVTIVRGTLEDFRGVERAINLHDVDTVFHLGAQTLVEPAQRAPLPTFEANIRGTWNVLEACRLHSSLVRRVVIASSDKAYGSSAVLPYTEDMPLLGGSPYEVSKSCADLIAQTYYSSYSVPVTIARCGNVFGGGDLNWSRIVPGTFRSLMTDSVPVIRSDGTFLRDYIYVEDVADAYLVLGALIGHPQVDGEAFNFSAESPKTVMEIYEEICAVMNVRVEPSVLGQARGEIENQYLSAAKARSVLNWTPRFSLREGLLATREWYGSFFGTA